MLAEADVDVKEIYLLLKEWFDGPTPPYVDFDRWRYQTYQELRSGRRRNLPLKTWWPRYTRGDFRLEVVVGALLIQRVRWGAVRECIQNVDRFLKDQGRAFDLEGLLSIPPATFEELIRPSRFPTQKSERVRTFCRLVKEGAGSIDRFFQKREVGELGQQLTSWRIGFGPETRDCVLLYAANLPVFIADTYARRLLSQLSGKPMMDYQRGQKIWQVGTQRACTREFLDAVMSEYTEDELRYAICNPESGKDYALVLLFQQLHAGIVELGIMGRWDEFREHLLIRQGKDRTPASLQAGWKVSVLTPLFQLCKTSDKIYSSCPKDGSQMN